MAKQKENRFESLLEKYNTKKELPSYKLSPSALSTVLGDFHLGDLYAWWGVAGCGKCLTGDARIYTPIGARKIKEFVKDPKRGFHPLECDVYTPFGVERTSHHYFDTCETMQIETRASEIKGTPEHPISVFDPTFGVALKKLSDITDSDYVAHNLKPFEFYPEIAISEDDAYWLGCLLGDGYFPKSAKRHCFGFTSSSENHVKEFKKHFKIKAKLERVPPSKEGYLWQYNCRSGKDDKYPDWLRPLYPCNSGTKFVPEIMFSQSIKVRQNFIYGLLDTDGSTTRGDFDITLKSEQLINDIRDIFNTLGIYPIKSTRLIDDTVYYRLSVCSSDFTFSPLQWTGRIKKIETKTVNFNSYDFIPFSKELYVELREFLKKEGEVFSYGRGSSKLEGRDKTRIITPVGKLLNLTKCYRQNGVSRQTLLALMDEVGDLPISVKSLLDFKFSKVIDTTSTGIEDVYDFSIPGSHTFYANAIINHNSTLGAQAARSLCRQGLKGLYIDVEKAFNENQIKSFRLAEFVESGQLIFLTCENMKELEEIVVSLADSDIDFFVCDSITMVRAYTPEELMITDIRPGLHALQEATVVGKMKDICYSKGIGGILLCHARANIQISGPINKYAPNEKMAGGFALQHVPSSILQIGVNAKIKDIDDKVIGNDVTLMTTKNKWVAPFQPVKETLIYGKGIDPRMSLIKRALDEGAIIHPKGARSYILPFEPDVKYNSRTIWELTGEQCKKLQTLMDSGELPQTETPAE